MPEPHQAELAEVICDNFAGSPHILLESPTNWTESKATSTTSRNIAGRNRTRTSRERRRGTGRCESDHGPAQLGRLVKVTPPAIRGSPNTGGRSAVCIARRWHASWNCLPG